MLLIKDVEMENVSGDFAEIITPDFNMHDPEYKAKKIKYIKETIYGTKFINERGQKICIGTTQKVQDTIGLCFGAFENQGNRIFDQKNHIIRLLGINKRLENKYENCLKENHNLKMTIDNIKKMNSFNKLKWLFS